MDTTKFSQINQARIRDTRRVREESRRTLERASAACARAVMFLRSAQDAWLLEPSAASRNRTWPARKLWWDHSGW
jgi:hypothetical protein